MLDKRDDNYWLASDFIRICAVIFVLGMIVLIWREWRSKNPIMNLKLFKFKNFAICAFLMMLVGGVLNASTVLQPEFYQRLLGDTPTVSGEALTGGVLVLLILAPLSGLASDKFAARTLAAGSFAFFAAVFYYSSLHINLSMSFGFGSWLRMLQVAAVALCFISITKAAYMGLA